MGSTIIEQDFPYDIIHRGSGDQARHNKRVNDALRKQIKDVISNQDIITQDGNKKVKVRLKHLQKYQFEYYTDRVDRIGRDEFNDLHDNDVLSKPTISGGKPVKASDLLGENIYEAEYTIDELVQIMFEELNLPNLDDAKRNEISIEEKAWIDRRKSVGILGAVDKRKTVLASILRRAKSNGKHRRRIIRDDFRFKTWKMKEKKHSNAVVFLMMDKSGSMSEKIYIVKALYFWIVQFLRHKYDCVEIRFISHDYDAQEMQEKEFFTISDSGGTKVSSAYNLCHDIIASNYPSSLWNVYCFHATDGDSYGDEDECVNIVRKILTHGAKLFAYTEICVEHWEQESKLYTTLFKAKKELNKLVLAQLRKREDIVNVLKKFLKHSVYTE